MTTLVMFSGGLDSTAMLVKLLASGAEELRVHHIHMVNREGRDTAERRAVDAIVAYCRAHYRPFRYSESALDFSGLEAIPIDYLSIAFVACQVAIDTPHCNRIALGALAADTDIANRCVRQKRVFDEMYACYRARKLGEPHVEWTYPVFHTPKAELAASLPGALLDLTWSCRRPLEGMLPCGICKACRVRKDLRIPAGAAENRV
jgi:7-cyano-7-deazaguanine synthase in queuosine biosynthesis